MTKKHPESGIDGSIVRTCLFPLYARAEDYLLNDSILADRSANELSIVVRREYGDIAVPTSLRLGCCLRSKIVDDWTRKLAMENDIICVVELGVGLNTRAQRLERLGLHWLEVDDTSLIELRRIHLPATSLVGRLSRTIFDVAELARQLSSFQPHRILFIAEGVLCYWDRSTVLEFISALRQRFGGAYFALDSMSPLLLKQNNKRKSPEQSQRPDYKWGCWSVLNEFGPDRVDQVITELGFSEYGEKYFGEFPLHQRLIYRIPIIRRMYRLSLIRLAGH